MKNGQGVARLKNLKLPLVMVIGLMLLGLPMFAGQFLSYLMLTFFAYAITVIGFNLSLVVRPRAFHGSRRLYGGVSHE